MTSSQPCFKIRGSPPDASSFSSTFVQPHDRTLMQHVRAPQATSTRPCHTRFRSCSRKMSSGALRSHPITMTTGTIWMSIVGSLNQRYRFDVRPGHVVKVQRGRVRNAIGCGLVELTTARGGAFDATSATHMVADTHHVPPGPTRET